MATEQELNDAVEQACGSIDKAFRLMRIWQDTSNPISHDSYMDTPAMKQDRRMKAFKNKAKNNGYSDKAINAYLRLQGL